MLRISKEQLVERWAFTYRQDGYDVRSEQVPGHRYPKPESGVTPDLEAIKDGQRVLVYIIDSPETLNDDEVGTDLQALGAARANGAQSHVVVAAECANAIKQRLEEWQVAADLIHVT